jgi:hypothetical protein
MKKAANLLSSWATFSFAVCGVSELVLITWHYSSSTVPRRIIGGVELYATNSELWITRIYKFTRVHTVSRNTSAERRQTQIVRSRSGRQRERMFPRWWSPVWARLCLISYPSVLSSDHNPPRKLLPAAAVRSANWWRNTEWISCTHRNIRSAAWRKATNSRGENINWNNAAEILKATFVEDVQSKFFIAFIASSFLD